MVKVSTKDVADEINGNGNDNSNRGRETKTKIKMVNLGSSMIVLFKKILWFSNGHLFPYQQ